jgi:SpoVK/Ycf46/Vps4 family AAA+-type ATPase
MFGGFLSGPVANKGFYNELLEGTHVPVLWTANSPESLDEAHLRRFSLIVELRAPPVARRREIAQEQAAAAGIEPAVLLSVAEDERLPLAMLETVKASVGFVRAARDADVAADVPCALPPAPAEGTVARQITSGFLRLVGGGSASRARPTSLRFDTSLLNASIDLDGVVHRLREHPQATILLSGLPGTGKSAWARALAESLGRPLVVCAPSDLLSKYVGDTEKRLAAAFARAEGEGAVLLLDEADTFLFPRDGARHSWEVSQTNEMLVRVESFQGILVATTNATERMDEAIHRRFDLKVELRPLLPEQRLRLVTTLATQHGLSVDDDGARAELARSVGTLAGLCCGDVVAVERRVRFSPVVDLAGLVRALADEVSSRGAKRARIGF